MGSAQDMIKMAESQLGYEEGYNNDTKYGQWYPMNHQPWCDMFVSWCAAQIGEGGTVGKYAYCPSHVQFFRDKGQWHSKNETAQPGDIVFYTWDGGPTADHVGIVTAISSSGNVQAIEGNSANAYTSEGKFVARHSRPRSVILGFGRPAYGGGSSGGGQVVIDGLAYGPGAKGYHITAMGQLLVKAGCSAYTEGPGPAWGDADTKSFKKWQYKIGDHGADADGIPGPRQLHLLQKEYGPRKMTVNKKITVTALAAILGVSSGAFLAANTGYKSDKDEVQKGSTVVDPDGTHNNKNSSTVTDDGNAKPDPKPTPPKPDPKPSPKPKPKPHPKPCPSNPFPGSGYFKYNASDNHYVLELDQALKKKGFGGFYDYGVSSYYGRGTKHAVMAFQLAQGWHGSEADGIPGPDTWKRLMG